MAQSVVTRTVNHGSNYSSADNVSDIWHDRQSSFGNGLTVYVEKQSIAWKYYVWNTSLLEPITNGYELSAVI